MVMCDLSTTFSWIMLQAAPKSQWLTTTKVCVSPLLHALCGLAACLYSGKQTANPPLSGPGKGWPVGRKGRTRTRHGSQSFYAEIYHSQSLPIGQTSHTCRHQGGECDCPNGEGQQVLGNKNRAWRNHEELRTLPGRQKDLDKL